MKISIIGSGNVATVLATLAKKNAHDIIEITGRNIEAAQLLAKKVNSKYNNHITFPNEVDIIIIAVSDNSIHQVINSIPNTKAIVVHTAGSVSINLFQNKFDNYGCIYPLQSLRKDMESIPTVPLLIEANNSKNEKLLVDFSNSLSNSVKVISEKERLYLHTSAVIVNNFTNYTLGQAYSLCEAEKINFELLKPLLLETLNRIENKSPIEMQTGPAKRNDTITINKHLEILEKYPSVKKLYTFLTSEIIEKYKH